MGIFFLVDSSSVVYSFTWSSHESCHSQGYSHSLCPRQASSRLLKRRQHFLYLSLINQINHSVFICSLLFLTQTTNSSSTPGQAPSGSHQVRVSSSIDLFRNSNNITQISLLMGLLTFVSRYSCHQSRKGVSGVFQVREGSEVNKVRQTSMAVSSGMYFCDDCFASWNACL